MTDVEQMIKAQEGTGPMVNGRFMPYLDSAGKWTIGYGRCIQDIGISEDEAEVMLTSDIAIAANDVRRLCSIYDELTRPRQLVLVSMALNLGYVRYAKWVHFWDAIHRKDWHGAADQILDSKAAREDAPARYKQLAGMMRMDQSQWV